MFLTVLKGKNIRYTVYQQILGLYVFVFKQQLFMNKTSHSKMFILES